MADPSEMAMGHLTVAWNNRLMAVLQPMQVMEMEMGHLTVAWNNRLMAVLQPMQVTVMATVMETETGTVMEMEMEAW